MSEDTHITHCCSTHGCKYGYDTVDCPVTSGYRKQAYECEYCEYAQEAIDLVMNDFLEFVRFASLEDERQIVRSFVERFKSSKKPTLEPYKEDE